MPVNVEARLFLIVQFSGPDGVLFAAIIAVTGRPFANVERSAQPGSKFLSRPQFWRVPSRPSFEVLWERDARNLPTPCWMRRPVHPYGFSEFLPAQYHECTGTAGRTGLHEDGGVIDQPGDVVH